MPLTLFIFILRPAGERAARRRNGETYLSAIADAVGWVFDDAVTRREAGGQLDDRTQVAFDGHRFEQYPIARVDGGDGQPLGVEDQRARRHAEHMRGWGDLQTDAGVVAGHHFAR